jgi:proteasome lid subunit RPN8/RPN11
MFQALVRTAERFINDVNRFVRGRQVPVSEVHPNVAAVQHAYRPLQRVTLTDEVSRTFFNEYAAHRESPRGHEETGWVLLGLREETEAIVLATLPAGTERNAGVAHVRFNSAAQALASRIVRQADRRLTMLGVVHTHPGSLRHPSDGDFRGDSQWVGRLRGQEGVFGIGTADDDPDDAPVYARQIKPNVQSLGPFCFSWYTLRHHETAYRPLTLNITLGPDLARPLHLVWPTIEAHADRLERLVCQQSRTRFEVIERKEGPALALTVPLAEPQRAVRVVLEENIIHYYLIRDGEVLAADTRETHVDRGVYLLLAELAAQA